MQVFSICNSISEGNLNWTKNKLVWQTSGSEEWQFFFNIIRTYMYNNLVLGDQRLFFCLIGNFNLDEIFDWYKMVFIWLKESSLAKMFNDVLCLILSLMVAFRFFSCLPSKWRLFKLYKNTVHVYQGKCDFWNV